MSREDRAHLRSPLHDQAYRAGDRCGSLDGPWLCRAVGWGGTHLFRTGQGTTVHLPASPYPMPKGSIVDEPEEVARRATVLCVVAPDLLAHGLFSLSGYP